MKSMLHRSDDWRASNGTVISGPKTEEERLFSTAYEYCTSNWCINDEEDSIFTYGAGESFGDINRCNLPYISKIETQVANPPQELVDICGSSVACLVDGLCGDTTDAAETLANENMFKDKQEYWNPTLTAWGIKYSWMWVDFGLHSYDELSVFYNIEINRAFETDIYESDYKTPITDIEVTLISAESYPKKANHMVRLASMFVLGGPEGL